jgi:hypothetical protein
MIRNVSLVNGQTDRLALPYRHTSRFIKDACTWQLCKVHFFMCSLDVKQTVCCNDMHFQCSAKYAFYLLYATPGAAHHVTCSAVYVFNVHF